MKGCHVTLALALAASCGGSEPSSSPPPPPPPPGPIRPAAQGAVRLLRPGFAFLPPLVPASAGSSPFDAGLTPTIVVCELQDNACTTTVGTFPAVLDQALEEYALTWSTANLDQSRGYRIRVNLWSLELGSLDLDIVSSTAELASVDANRFVGVVKGTELPIRFRIEEPALWSGLPALTSNRSSAPPGGMLVLSGFDVSPLAQEKLSLVVGPAPAPMTSNAPAGVAAAVPLFLDATLNSRPPQGPQHVVLLENGVPRAGARRALTLTALPDAPGASESALAALEAIMADLSDLVELVDETRDEEGMYRYGFARGFAEFIGGNDPRTMKSALAAADAPTRRLIDAVLKSSGVVAALSEYASRLDVLTAGLEASHTARGPGAPGVLQGHAARGAQAPASVSDLVLAEQMQLYVVLKLFGQIVVAETSAEFGQTVGVGAATLGLVACVPAAQVANAIISIVLAAADFWVNKVLVGLFPARLTTFDLSVADDTLRQGQITDATLTAVAVNDAAPLMLNEIVDNVLTVLGLANAFAPCGGLPAFREVVQNQVDYFLSLVRLHMATYGQVFGLSTQFEVVSLPALSWQARITSPRLVERRSGVPAIVDGDSLEVNWRARNDGLGDAEVYAFPEGPPRGLLLELPPGFTYAGRAFGEDPAPSNKVEISVRAPVALEVDFPLAVAPGAMTTIRVQAGYLDPDDQPVWKPGIQLALSAEGGVLEASSGVTDASGAFETRALLTPGSSQVIIHVTATAPFGRPPSLTSTVTACASANPSPSGTRSGAASSDTCDLGIIVLVQGQNRANVHADGAVGCDSPVVDIPGSTLISTLSFNASGQCSGTVLDNKDVTASGSAQSSYTLAATGPFVLTGSASTAASATTEAIQGRAEGDPRVQNSLRFVLTESMHYELTGGLGGVHALKSGDGIVYKFASAGFALRRVGGPVVVSQTAVSNLDGQGPASVTLASTGVLEPGTYQLFLNLEALARAVPAPGFSASASASGTFTFRLTP